MSYTVSFGFLDYDKPLCFSQGTVTACADFQDRQAAVRECLNIDGFVYQPIVSKYRASLDGSAQESVPNTRRPAPVFTMPLSHKLLLHAPLAHEDLRHEDAGLIVHLLAFFFGTRLQFEGWAFDGRVPVQPTNGFVYDENTPAHYVEFVYEQWRTWSAELRRRYINILFMHTRTESYEWEWDRFSYRYMVFDAICRFHEVLEKKRFQSHSGRVIALCERYDIPQEAETIRQIVALRNELFHEALWDGATPGQGGLRHHLVEKWLGRLNERLIVAMAGYRNSFIRHGWWFLGWQPFDRFYSA